MDNDHYYLESYEIYSAEHRNKTDGATALNDLPQTLWLWKLSHLYYMNHTVSFQMILRQHLLLAYLKTVPSLLEIQVNSQLYLAWLLLKYSKYNQLLTVVKLNNEKTFQWSSIINH